MFLHIKRESIFSSESFFSNERSICCRTSGSSPKLWKIKSLV